MKRMLVVLAAGVLLLAGCTSAPVTPPTATPSTSPIPVTDPPSSPAAGLVGVWRVSDAPGEGKATWIRFDVDDVMFWDSCGVFDGQWRGVDGHIAALFDAAVVEKCRAIPSRRFGPPWMAKVRTYERDGAKAWVLRGENGLRLARLTIDGTPPTGKNYASSLTEDPVLTAADRKKLAEPSPLPAGIVPVTSLIGRWVPLKPVAKAYISFGASGSFEGTDGCNPMQGRWALGADGAFVLAGGSVGMVGCAGSPLQYWAAEASRAGMQGNRLSFFDGGGRLLGQAVRAGQ
jgi:heat shock protein HslJ